MYCKNINRTENAKLRCLCMDKKQSSFLKMFVEMFLTAFYTKCATRHGRISIVFLTKSDKTLFVVHKKLFAQAQQKTSINTLFVNAFYVNILEWLFSLLFRRLVTKYFNT